MLLDGGRHGNARVLWNVWKPEKAADAPAADDAMDVDGDDEDGGGKDTKQTSNFNKRKIHIFKAEESLRDRRTKPGELPACSKLRRCTS